VSYVTQTRKSLICATAALFLTLSFSAMAQTGAAPAASPGSTQAPTTTSPTPATPAPAHSSDAPAAPTDGRQVPPPSFTLDLAAAGAQNVPLTVATPSSLAIRILNSGGMVKGDATLDISEFRSEQGAAAPVLFSVAGGKPVAHLDGVKFDRPVLPVDLHVPALPTAGKYSGDLILTASNASGATQLAIWHFILTSAKDIRPATLVIDQPGTIPLTAVRSWCFLVRKWNWCTRADRPIVTLRVRDKSGSWPLEGVMTRLEPGLSAPGPGFDPKAHIDGTFNGNKMDLFASPGSAERNVGLGGQATISLTFKDFPAGEYTIPLRFAAMNSIDDDAQRLAVSLKVRNSVWGAVVVLVLAALFSFVATRIVAQLRQRATFLQRLQSMRPTWLADEPPFLPVIWVRAALREAEDLSDKYWISGQSEINTRLDSVASILAVLDRVRQVRDQIRMSIQNYLVKRRALIRLNAITQQIGAGPLTDPDVTRLKAQLDELAKWCDAAQMEQLYWADVQPSITEFCAQIQIADIPNDARTGAQNLLARIHQAIQQQPAGLSGKCAAEEDYARLKILWELRADETQIAQQRQQLMLLPQWPDAPIERVYALIDDFWWQRLTELPASQVKIVAPQVDFKQPETYSALNFGVRVEDTGLRESYLVNQKLTWQWTVTINTKPPWWAFLRKPQTVTLKPGSKEPKIAQYSPQPGTITSSVHVGYDGRHRNDLISQDGKLVISKSNDFKIRSLFAYSDVFAFGAALIAAVVSGIALYALAPSFGSFKDYLTLFTWGAAIDQGKNFVQSLAVYSSNKP